MVLGTFFREQIEGYPYILRVNAKFFFVPLQTKGNLKKRLSISPRSRKRYSLTNCKSCETLGLHERGWHLKSVFMSSATECNIASPKYANTWLDVKPTVNPIPLRIYICMWRLKGILLTSKCSFLIPHIVMYHSRTETIFGGWIAWLTRDSTIINYLVNTNSYTVNTHAGGWRHKLKVTNPCPECFCWLSYPWQVPKGWI